jgi:thymidine phosphorylase
VGTGAFMKDLAQARELAETMVGLGGAHGVRTMALLTQMDVPLGRTAGNALEVTESVEVLAGGGPSDLVELTVALAREMLDLVGIDVDPGEVLARGGAMDAWQALVRAQGGDPDAVLPVASEVEVVRAPATGTLARLDAMGVGVAAWRLGAGRSRKEDPVSPIAGVVWHATVGDEVVEGQPLLELHLDDATRLPGALAALDGAIEVSAPPPPPPPPRPPPSPPTPSSSTASPDGPVGGRRRALGSGDQRFSTEMGSMPSSGRPKPSTWA